MTFAVRLFLLLSYHWRRKTWARN